MNHTALSARIANMSPLRYTPAGVPALDLTLAHASRVIEAGQPRDARLEMPAVALGTVAERIATRPLGSVGCFSGFLASRRGVGGRAVLHVLNFAPETVSGCDAEAATPAN